MSISKSHWMFLSNAAVVCIAPIFYCQFLPIIQIILCGLVSSNTRVHFFPITPPNPGARPLF